MPTSVGLRRWSVGMLAVVIATPLHLHLLKSNPASGASLTNSPREIRLVFSGPVTLASMTLLDAAGRHVALGPVSLSVDSLLAIGSGRDSVVHNAGVVVAPIRQPLKPGSYRVIWKATGRDGHPVKKQLAFTVAARTQVPSSAAKPQTQTPESHDTSGSHANR